MSQTNKTKNTRPKAMGRRGFLLTVSAAMMFAADAQAGPFAGRARPLAGRLGRSTGGDGAVKTVDNVSLTDPSRGRTFLLRAYYPAAAGTYPTIVFSHGFGADMSAFEQTSRDWAAQGYVAPMPIRFAIPIPRHLRAVRRRCLVRSGRKDQRGSAAFTRRRAAIMP